MCRIHFYKAKSRLGIINPLPNTKDLNIGVEDGPDAILTKEFLLNFANPQVSEFTFSKPEAIMIRDCFAPSVDGARNDNEKKHFDVLARELSEFKNLINKTIKTHETQIVIGGDNSVTFSSLLAVLERAKDVSKVGYIQFDSHGELNLYKTSPTKNFHGMYIRPFLDSFDIPKIRFLINTKLNPNNALFIGNLDLDEEEKVYFKNIKLKNITRDMVLQNNAKVIKELKNFASRFDYLHVNFDIDLLSHKEVLATGLPSENGFKFYEIEPILRIISKHKKLTFDLCEVNPQKRGRNRTVKIAQRILETMFSEVFG